jgi:hypothetical protein
MLAGNNVFGSNLLFAFVEGKSDLSEALSCSADTRKWHSCCCTLQPPSGINARSKTQGPLIQDFHIRDRTAASDCGFTPLH